MRAGSRRNDGKRGARNGVAPYSPAAFCRDAGSADHGATEAARRNGRCKPGFRVMGWKPAGRRRFTGSVHDSPPGRLPYNQTFSKQENQKRDNEIDWQENNEY